MSKTKNILKEILWWEIRRPLFNFVMLITGIFIMITIQQVKASKPLLSYYIDLIVVYAIVANFFYAVVYAHNFLLINKLDELKEKAEEIKQLTLNTIIIAGICLNFILGSIELLFRLFYLD